MILRLILSLICAACVITAHPLFASHDKFDVELGHCNRFLTQVSRPVGARAYAKVVNIGRSQAKGPWGGELWDFTKEAGVPWYSYKQAYPGAPHGDPTWFLLTFGDETANFFGMQKINESHIVAPGGDAIGAGVDELNQFMHEVGIPFQIAVRFYSSPEGLVGRRIYLRRFGRSGELPVGDGLEIMIHDIAYHVGTIVLPTSTIHLGRAQTRYIMDFVDFLEGAQKSADFESFSDRLMQAKVDDIDAGTADAFMMLNEYTGTLPPEKIIGENLLSIAGENRSPHDYIADFVSHEHNVELSQRWQQFVAIHQHEAEFHAVIDAEELKTLCRQVETNLRTIQEAVRRHRFSRP